MDRNLPASPSVDHLLGDGKELLPTEHAVPVHIPGIDQERGQLGVLPDGLQVSGELGQSYLGGLSRVDLVEQFHRVRSGVLERMLLVIVKAQQMEPGRARAALHEVLLQWNTGLKGWAAAVLLAVAGERLNASHSCQQELVGGHRVHPLRLEGGACNLLQSHPSPFRENGLLAAVQEERLRAVAIDASGPHRSLDDRPWQLNDAHLRFKGDLLHQVAVLEGPWLVLRRPSPHVAALEQDDFHPGHGLLGHGEQPGDQGLRLETNAGRGERLVRQAGRDLRDVHVHQAIHHGKLLVHELLHLGLLREVCRLHHVDAAAQLAIGSPEQVDDTDVLSISPHLEDERLAGLLDVDFVVVRREQQRRDL
mmetsp:Transcript_34127/g.61415  ORF Transcript_34127/g.61415 Transcript_34127/m.61415 type:complete len:364 (-) Transcript_34127:715-1806(-)